MKVSPSGLVTHTEPRDIEDAILEDLGRPLNSDTVGRFQYAAIGALCDLYDRKVTSENYSKMATATVELYASCARLWQFHKLREAFQRGDVTLATIDRAIDGTERSIRSQVGAVENIIKLLQQCANDPKEVN